MQIIKKIAVQLLLCMMIIAPTALSAKKNKANSYNGNPAYMLYNDKGKAVNYSKMISKLVKSDVIFIGEFHNSSIVHWLEYEIVKSIAGHFDNKISVGMEMMEVDNQGKIDEYMADLISKERYLAETHLWPNYKMDYSPIVEFAKDKEIKLVATNVPRRYARALSNRGVDALREFPEESQKHYIEVLNRVAKIDVADNIYTMMFKSKPMGKKSDTAKKPALSDKQKKKILLMTQAQALKDAVMANNIAKNLEYPFVHINGNYHSDYKKGIITYLSEENPKLKIVTITTVYQDDLSSLEVKRKNRADFYIVVPTDTHKTY